MKIAVVNESTLMSEAQTQLVVNGLRASTAVFAADWDLVRPSLEHAKPGEEQAEIDEPHGCVIVLLDDADQAGALGYHATTPKGLPYAAVFVRDSVRYLGAGHTPTGPIGDQDVALCVFQVVDHEAKEAMLDPDAADFVDDGTGRLWAKEACDAVEADTFAVTVPTAKSGPVGLLASNYVLPAFFAVGADGPYDALGVLTAPFTIAPGGYTIVEQGGQVGQRFGEVIAPWRYQKHCSAFSAANGSTATASRTGWRVVHYEFER